LAKKTRLVVSGWSLPAAFGLADKGELVALVGGGGKSSLLAALADAAPGNALLTTTTRLFAAQAPALSPLTAQFDALPADFWREFSRQGRGIIVGPPVGEKVSGVPVDLPGQWLARPEVDWLLAEADGSRHLPIKAPAPYEPAVPPETTLFVGVMGIDALAGPIGQVAHRPELICRLLDRAPEETLTPADIARLMTHPQGGWQGRPSHARAILFINKVETAAQLQQARQIAQFALQNVGLERVIIGKTDDRRWTTDGRPSSIVHRPSSVVHEVWRHVTAVILAAGQGKRMGRTKQLLPWGETTVLGQVIANVRATSAQDVVVVAGHEAERVTAAARTAGARTVYNPDYESGEMLSSLQTAVRELGERTTAVLVLLADQPMLGPEPIEAVLTAYREGERGLIAPVFNGRRGHPPLIGQDYFAELLALPASAAPRDLLRRHERDIHLVPVTSDAILRDLDVPADYAESRP
jgi:molybdenum cofactor cytidylyltransferase